MLVRAVIAVPRPKVGSTERSVKLPTSRGTLRTDSVVWKRREWIACTAGLAFGKAGTSVASDTAWRTILSNGEMPLLIRCRCNERFLLMKLRVGIGSARSGGAGAISRHERRTCSTTPIAQTRSGPRVPPGNLGGPRLTRLDGRVPPQMQPVLSHGFSGQSGGRLERRMLAIQCRNRQTDAYFGAARRTYPLCLTRFASWARLRFRRCVSTILERPGAEDAPPPCPIPTYIRPRASRTIIMTSRSPSPPLG
jgi:hypothetical protein